MQYRIKNNSNSNRVNLAHANIEVWLMRVENIIYEEIYNDIFIC